MRTAFINTLTRMAGADGTLYLLTADVGFSVFEEFARLYPERFINLGIAEANLMGVAAGLAMSGKNVFVYSMVPFITMRCYEQIRMDLCYQRVNVKVVGVGGGLSYGAAGASHHAIEDIAVMRVLPGMTVICPGDPVEVEYAVMSTAECDGPVYIRLGKNGEPRVHHRPLDFGLGRAVRMREGRDLSLIATGNMLSNACAACDLLTKAGLNPRLLSMHTIKPLDKQAIHDCLRETAYVFTLEEHNVLGGLGGAVAEVAAECVGPHVPVMRIGINDYYHKEVGGQEYLRAQSGLSAERIAGTILGRLEIGGEE